MACELASTGFAVTGLVGPDGRMDFTKDDSVSAALLQLKRQCLMDVAKLFGWIIERKEDISRIEERLRNMTPEQREADAEDLCNRAMRRLLEDDRARGVELEGGIGCTTEGGK